MKRIVSLFMLVILAFSLVACDNGAENVTVDITAAGSSIKSELSMSGAMDLSAERLLDLYGIEGADIDTAVCFVTMDGVFPDEIIMVNAVSAEAADRIEEKLENRLNEVKVQSQSYDPENYAMAQECQVFTKGLTVALFLSPNHEKMEEIFANAPALS